MTTPNPTPSLAGTAETMTIRALMTAEDAEYVRRLMCGRLLQDESQADFSADDYARILATYHALAASQQEVTRLRTVLGERHGDILRLEDENADLRASLALARRDGERIDLLAKWAATPLELDRMGGLEGDAPVGPFFLTFESPEVTQYSAPTLRDVIDKVEAAIQSTAIASSPPPETTQGATE